MNPAIVKPDNEKFNILIAIHRPRYRGRVERACAVPGWEVVSLLNKQDVVGAVERKSGKSPDIVILSTDFGRQKSLGIFKAIQARRHHGMRIIALAEDPESAAAASEFCDKCILPPIKTAEIREMLLRVYSNVTGKPAPILHSEADTDIQDDEHEN